MMVLQELIIYLIFKILNIGNQLCETKRYKFKRIFVSGDGLIASKNLNDIFPNFKFVFDPFH